MGILARLARWRVRLGAVTVVAAPGGYISSTPGAKIRSHPTWAKRAASPASSRG